MYQRELRAKPGQGLAVVADLPAVDKPPTVDGTVAEAVQAQIEALGVTDRPALEAICRVMAQGLDNPAARPQHAALARQLVVSLGQLAQGSQRRGRLASVQRMTDRKRG